jgi:hypothetical protein
MGPDRRRALRSRRWLRVPPLLHDLCRLDLAENANNPPIARIPNDAVKKPQSIRRRCRQIQTIGAGVRKSPYHTVRCLSGMTLNGSTIGAMLRL